MALLRGLRGATARLPRRPPPSTRRRALTSTKERSETSRENLAAWKSDRWHRYGVRGPSDAVLGAGVVLFFGGGIYAFLLSSGKQWSIPADPTDERNAGWDGEQFTRVKNVRYKGWRSNFTDEELEKMGDNPTEAQEAAILAARRQAYTPIAEIVAAAPVVVFSAEGCPFCDEAKAALRGAGVAFTEVSASDWQRARLRELTGSRTVPQVFAGGEFVGGCHDGGLGGTVPLLRMGLLQAMAARAAGDSERDREKRERDEVQAAARAAAENELARLRRQLAAEKKG